MLYSVARVIELLLSRGSPSCSAVRSTKPTAVLHAADVPTRVRGWAMEDAVYSSQPRFTRFRSEQKEVSRVTLPTANLEQKLEGASGVKIPTALLALNRQPPDLTSHSISESRDSDSPDSSRCLARALASQ
jgi:hypothetical protein